MNGGNFEKLLGETINSIQNTLASKNKEYGQNDDRLYNFKRAGEIGRCSPVEALKGMWLKHVVSVFDLIEGNLMNKEEIVNEKIGDSINYLILLKALLAESRAGAERHVDIQRICNNCKYLTFSTDQEPCRTCTDYIRFTPRN
jgi:hypothetical protein